MCPQFYRGACLKPKIIILVNYKTYQCHALFLLTNTRHFFDLPMPNTFWQRQQRMLALRDIGLMYRKNSDHSRSVASNKQQHDKRYFLCRQSDDKYTVVLYNIEIRVEIPLVALNRRQSPMSISAIYLYFPCFVYAFVLPFFLLFTRCKLDFHLELKTPRQYYCTCAI